MMVNVKQAKLSILKEAFSTKDVSNAGMCWREFEAVTTWHVSARMNSAMFVDKDGTRIIIVVILGKQLQVQKGQEFGKKIRVESKQEGEMMRREEDDNSDKHADENKLSVRIKGWLSFTVQKNNLAGCKIFWECLKKSIFNRFMSSKLWRKRLMWHWQWICQWSRWDN